MGRVFIVFLIIVGTMVWMLTRLGPQTTVPSFTPVTSNYLPPPPCYLDEKGVEHCR